MELSQLALAKLMGGSDYGPKERARHAVRYALRTGKLLVEQKASLSHGEFTPWMQKHLPFSVRTAQRYMIVYRRRDELKNDSVSLLAEAYTPQPSKRYELHEAALAFPWMTDNCYQGLRDDIAAHGLAVPITLYEGRIIDGKCRYKACLEVGVEPRFREYDGNPWAYVWSMNGLRYHHTEEQRYLIYRELVEREQATAEGVTVDA